MSPIGRTALATALLSRTRRRRRPGEWTPAKTVTFIVTLAAHGNVTLAANASGLSRKSAYALKARDPAFASAWESALDARRAKVEGDKVEEVEEPPVSPGQGDTRRRDDNAARDRFFGRLAAKHRLSPPAASGLLPARKPLSV